MSARSSRFITRRIQVAEMGAEKIYLMPSELAYALQQSKSKHKNNCFSKLVRQG